MASASGSASARELKTSSELLLDDLAGVRRDLLDLVTRSTLRDWRSSLTGIIYAGPTNEWNDLDTDDQRVQSRLLEDYRRAYAVVRTLTRALPAATRETVTDADKVITEILERKTTWHDEPSKAAAAAAEAFDTIAAALDRLHDRGEGLTVYIPDTSALLESPALEEWRFGGDRFEILLVPTVLGELDELRVAHRNEGYRAIAAGLVTRIKGYRSRGDLGAGVPLRKGVSTLRSTALEPDFAETLPWLDRDNHDDRILAAVVEAIRQHPRSPVVLVTTDLNLQNKAEFARLPFVEPPPGS